jgi:hypothetical protein
VQVRKREKHVIRCDKGRSPYLKRLAVDDKATIELILQKVKFVLGLFGSLDYMSSMVSTVHHITATRATETLNSRLATWWMY